MRETQLSPVKSGLFYFKFIITYITTVILLLSCNYKNKEYSKKIIIKVSSYEMTAHEFAEILAKKLFRYDSLTAKDPTTIERAKNEIILDFIIKGIIKDFAEKNKIQLDDNSFNKEIEQIRKSYPDDLAFRRELAKEGLSITEWRDSMKNYLIQKAVLSQIGSKVTPPTDIEINQYYESKKDEFKHNEMIFLKQIVTYQSSDADKIKEHLKNQNFDKLAREFSITPEAKQNGLVGWVEKGTLDIFDKAFSLPLKKISDIFQSPYGYHIFLVEAKKAAGFRPISEVKKIIQLRLNSQKEQSLFSSWLDQQLRSTIVLKDSKLIQEMNVETRSE